MTNRLVLHVGAPKTGSTYLQLRLRANAAALRAHGVYVPELPEFAAMAGNAKLLATALCSEPSMIFRQNFPQFGTSTLEPARVLADLLAGWHPAREAVILSAETFQPEHAAPLRELIPANVACKVVLVVRRQDRWIESYWNQMIKTGSVYLDLASFITELCDNRDEHLCRPDWFAHFSAWHDAFGNCEVVFYDEVGIDLFPSFLAAAAVGTPPDVIDMEPVKLSLDAHQLAYLLEVDRPITPSDFARRRAATAEAARRLPAPARRSFLSASDRAHLAERFEASNQRLVEAVGRSPDRSPLAMTGGEDTASRFDDVYSSGAYIAHRGVADAIYAAGR